MGKINVPDDILNKLGKLSPEEFSIIKKHSEDGADLVKGTYYANLSKIIEQHHERVDGLGYPHGLCGDSIKLEAKIISVADAYDAMTTDRPYRSGMGVEKAIKELLSQSSKQFDSEVVKVFIQVLIEEGLVDETFANEQLAQ